MFDLTIKTLQGSCKFNAVPPELTVEEFKSKLHEAAVSRKLTGLNIPNPENQNIVHNGKTLFEGTIEEAGIQSGDAVVVLDIPSPRPIPQPPRPKILTAEDIAEAIKAYAVKYGLEAKLTAPEERRTPRSRALPSTDHAGFRTDRLRAMIDALAQSFGRHRDSNEEDDEEPEEEPEFVVPEANPEHMRLLTEEIGIQTEVAIKALLLCRNNLAMALNWICEHGDDDDIATPIPESTLRVLYGTRRGRRRSNDPPPEHVQHLVEMGFDHQEAADALRRLGNNLNLAVSALLRRREREATGEGSSSRPAVQNSEGEASNSPMMAHPVSIDTDETLPPSQDTPEPNEVEPNVRLNPVSPTVWEDVDANVSDTESSETDLSDHGEIVMAPESFPQSELGGVTFDDVERSLEGDMGMPMNTSLFSHLRQLLEDPDASFVHPGPSSAPSLENIASDVDTAAFISRLRDLLEELGQQASLDNDDDAGPSGEAHHEDH